MKKLLLALSLTVAILGVSADPAAAHYVYDRFWTLRSGSDCVLNYAEVSHGSAGGGYYRADVSSYYASASGGECVASFTRGSGQLAILMDGFRWDGNAWQLCWGSGWVHNSSSRYVHRVTINHPHRTPTCGDGYYGMNANGWMYNGSWKGGVIWSGYHYLPA